MPFQVPVLASAATRVTAPAKRRPATTARRLFLITSASSANKCASAWYHTCPRLGVLCHNILAIVHPGDVHSDEHHAKATRGLVEKPSLGFCLLYDGGRNCRP